MYQSGIDTNSKFKNAWRKVNGNNFNDGIIPTVKNNYSSQERQKQESFIVAENNNKYPTDRTHLIPLSVTGIECHRGLLIDFDSDLNRNQMNNFEQDSLSLTKNQDIIWISIVKQVKNGLLLKELIFDTQYQMLKYHNFIDNRHNYIWWV